MCIAQIVSCVLFGQVAVQEDITLTNQGAAVREISVRALAGRIAQFMVMTRGVYEDIGFSFLAYRACLKKLMSLKSSRPFFRENHARLRFYRHHIFFKFQNCTAVTSKLVSTCQNSRHCIIKAGIQPHAPVIICQNAGIKRKLISPSSSPECAVRIVNMTQKFIFSRRCIADRHAHNA